MRPVKPTEEVISVQAGCDSKWRRSQRLSHLEQYCSGEGETHYHHVNGSGAGDTQLVALNGLRITAVPEPRKLRRSSEHWR
jgi:hypothetical protein